MAQLLRAEDAQKIPSKNKSPAACYEIRNICTILAALFRDKSHVEHFKTTQIEDLVVLMVKVAADVHTRYTMAGGEE